MNARAADLLARWLVAWVDLVRRRARLVITVDLIVTVALGVFTATHLGMNMDHTRLMASDLPFRKAATDYARYFPSLDNSLLIVIDAVTPEVARGAARTLAAQLRKDPSTFSDVYVPGADPFFQQRGLLYRSPDELDDFTDHLARLQPVIAELSRDPSIGNLAELIRRGLDAERARGVTGEEWARVLDRIGEATVRVFDEHPVSVSWETLMLEGSALDPGTRQVLVAEPVLEFGKLLVAERAIGAIRGAARDLSLVPERGVRVRVTGNPALNYEEMLGLAWDIGAAGLLSFALVTGTLFLAYRSLRLVSAAALTLLAGLVWTAAFAAASVGQLNVLSIAFGVLFIGLGVDFAIHLGMHYADAAFRGAAPTEALRDAVRRVGRSLVVCAVTTAIGFFAFVPTDYRGVAELGLISGAGMFVILIQTLTAFPALVVLLLGDGATRQVRAPLRVRLSPPRIVARYPGTIAVVSAVLGVTFLAQLPRARFDSHVVKMRDPRTESVAAFTDLLAESETSPWHIDVLAPDLASADRVGERLRQLGEVDTAHTLSDFVPADQEEKIEILRDAALILDTPRGTERERSALGIEEQVEALRELHAALDTSRLAGAATPLLVSARQLREELGRFLARIEEEGAAEQALADLERILLGSFPRQIVRLRRALEPPPIDLDALPEGLRRRMLAPDGHARVQVFPRGDLGDSEEMQRFVDAVRGEAPDATGVAVNLVEFGRATARSLRQAFATAAAAIALLLLLAWRRPVDVAIVLAPLILAAALTGGTLVLLDSPFNFGNVVVLPLLLGVGVDSGIHLLHRSRSVGPAEGDLLETTTARAVFFSALTTTASFGTLAWSAHGGIAAMGVLLVFGMVAVLACTLIVLPALITLRARWGARAP